MKLVTSISLLCLLCAHAQGARKSKYQELLLPLDLYTVPKEVTNVMKRQDLFNAIATNGLPIKISKEDVAVAEETHELVYDQLRIPYPTLSAGYGMLNTPSAVPTYSRSFSLGLELKGSSPWGFQYSVDLPKLTRFSNELPPAPGLTEVSTFGVGANLTINLLRGSVFFLGTVPKRQADIELEIAKEGLKGTALAALLQGEQAFYDVLLKQMRVKVLESAVESAKALREDILERVRARETGQLSQVKVELQVAQTETDLLAAEADLSAARQTLRNIIALRENEQAEFYPDPNEIKAVPLLPDLTIQNAIDRARRQRPDWISSLLQKRRAELESESAYSKILPKVDLKLGYGYVGVGTNIGSAVEDASTKMKPQYSAGVEMSYTFFNDADKTRYRQTRILVNRSELSIEQLNNQLIRDVTTAARNVELGSRRLATSELARSLSEKKLQAEYEKFKLGESSLRNIIDFQAEVNNSRIGEIASRVDLLKNLAAFKNATGEFPEGISIRDR